MHEPTASYPGPDVSGRTPEIPVELDGVAGEIAKLHDRLERLGGKIAPILRDPGPEPPSDPKLSEAPRTHHGARLRALAEELSTASRIVDDLISRIEV